MSVFAEKPVEKEGGIAAQVSDPRLTPTPDYGSVGPDADFAKSGGGLTTPNSPKAVAANRDLPRNFRALSLLAAIAGMAAAFLASGRTTGWPKISSSFSNKKVVVSSPRIADRDLRRQQPQAQAETLLTQAVSRSAGATDEIQSHVDGWRGKIRLSSQLSQLTTVALNSDDAKVRSSGIEVQLAAYGLSKNDSTVDRLIVRANSSDQAQKIWALWSLGLLGNRGVETDRIVQVLTEQLKGSGKDSRTNEEDSRRWAVEALALVGTTQTIAPLLDAMHNDPSPLVRERAACSLAESGMLTHEQRLTAVPQLINDSDDPALDAQTHAWAFQALHDITKQLLPNDSGAWRTWYQNSAASGQ